MTISYIAFDGATKDVADLLSDNGAARTASPPYTLVVYAGSGFTYYCSALPGTARSGSTWQVYRKTDATGDFVYAGSGLFAHAATSLAVVAALSYSLGA